VDLFNDGDIAPALDDAASFIAKWEADQLGFVTFRDEAYPAQLREIHEMPPDHRDRRVGEGGSTPRHMWPRWTREAGPSR
jgi:DNA processing protein